MSDPKTPPDDDLDEDEDEVGGTVKPDTEAVATPEVMALLGKGLATRALAKDPTSEGEATVIPDTDALSSINQQYQDEEAYLLPRYHGDVSLSDIHTRHMSGGSYKRLHFAGVATNYARPGIFLENRGGGGSVHWESAPDQVLADHVHQLPTLRVEVLRAAKKGQRGMAASATVTQIAAAEKAPLPEE